MKPRPTHCTRYTHNGAAYDVYSTLNPGSRPSFGYHGGDPGEPAFWEVSSVAMVPGEGGTREGCKEVKRLLTADGPDSWEFQDRCREAESA